MRRRVQALAQGAARSAGARHGLVMGTATLLAGGFDYLVNVLIGRLLLPAEFSVFVAVTALLQVMVHLTNVIRNVVAFYTAELTVQPQAVASIGLFLRRRWRWAWQWGLAATAGMALLSPALASLLRLDSAWPLWAGSALLLLLFLRPVTDGALQGLQQFLGLGTVQVLQALLRLLLAPALIWLGWQATGAIFSLPLASAGALLLALWLLGPYLGAAGDGAAVREISWRYSAHTVVGLLAFALLVNVDALVVKRVFSPEVAGQYGPVVTLGKINLFIPLGIGLVLFPKATQRQAGGRDARPVLLLALAATLLPGLALTAVYFLIPAGLVQAIFSEAYADPGLVLGLVGLATTLYAGINIWLNYALSLGRPAFVYALGAAVVGQVVGMALFHDNLLTIATIMVVVGLAGNVVGALTTIKR
ncbi:MAG: hypothetical protein L0332_10575 [Chloroflexi bacterium]|nr:hypothetical protein [Chloroflexota bacterium]MCI0576112.1 hypothetical protein [Chloroflexota bacterium]MCI0647900.1 hypothetical protein [Chloroflexota bacterium]MCI0727151.1 hypothetical protein [Chloroflexota bacterium]